HDLLDVTNIEAGHLSIERREEDMVILLFRAIEMFQPIADERGIALAAEVPPHLPKVFLDAERILQVLSNLLGNSIKFVGGGGSVTLRAVKEHGAVHVSVADDGPGIPAEELPHVFDRFWHSRRPSSPRGSGLGLAIAKGIVDAHRGRIWIESVVGEGTTVHLTLPVREG
ncbi:MAG: histidine kinase, partial [Gemmatimonadaceae bacterium]|nr:histidine kinase [Gemmatimonadaceae bacterium]